MNIPFKTTALAAVLAGIACASHVWANEDMPETDTTEVEVVEVANTVSGDRIAGMFSDFFGSDEASQGVVAGLRDGSIHYVEPVVEGEGDVVVDVEVSEDGVEVEVTEDGVEIEEGATAGAGMGYGNVLITMALAEQLAGMSQAQALEGELGMTADESLNEILRMRQVDGMGWGNIAKELGVNLGEIMSGIHSNRPDMTEKLASRDLQKSMRAEKHADRDLARAERTANTERAAKVERVAKVDRPEKPVRPEKAERPEKPQRPERPGK
ncbi:hypothetical protein M0G74_05335 [Microbulbifer sp. CAU 1566]|uniref:hypothetical protein n=1 Tax=Microbulbifer sp. CAU 1566 TaxID=2933269 RepID=UPI002005D1A5|nr:hypothetical protein [Microbulbifer sp. CAU 1566]MCK7596695.1 hypothetical protein [Microbulbifer sp. CAU 1566]